MSAYEIRSDEITEYLERLSPGRIVRWLVRARDQVGEAAAEGAREAYGAAGFPYSRRRGLYSSIGWKRFRQEPPVGFVAGPMWTKRSFYRHMVEGGTSAHRVAPKKKRVMAWTEGSGRRRFASGPMLHPGAAPNPWMTRSRSRILAAAQARFEELVGEELT